ncbi:ABC transporter permease subunit [Halovivax gelatinilyticus]|uniref:ABC transporter permease subunit n=1 Tax=Halovivax gelatinilyticus TaxID=2961597 RepID=UPI0020CA2BE6|nr:ABC transporter permease subunit [Halovivax gelatinilyticus]
MTELARYYARNRIRGSIYLAAAMSVLAALVIWVYPSFSEAFDDELLEAYPDAMLQAFDIRTMESLEGFLAFELYIFGWVILLGLYLAYAAAGTIADDVDRGRTDILLSMPLSRARFVLESFVSLAVPILVVNVVTPVVVYVAAELIDEPMAAMDLIAVHALSIPYLFACAAIGLLASVAVDRAAIAQRLSLGIVFGLFMVESLLDGTDYEAVGALTPMRYYDPNEILLEGTYDLVGATMLVLATIGLLVVSQLWFRRRDI